MRDLTHCELDRRQLLAGSAAAAGAWASHGLLRASESADFQLRYLLASCMYGYAPLGEIVPQVRMTGAEAIDIWPKVHGNQREQLDEMGVKAFRDLLREHSVGLGCLTQYKLGPFQLAGEMRLARQLGCSTIVTGGRGPKGLRGQELKQAVREFLEQMKPHLALAAETGVTIAIENHGNNLIQSPDSLKWLVELGEGQPIGIALAPYHLPQDEALLAGLIRDLGNRIAVFYAWQHGMGCMQKLPKEQELLQMPGRGELDFQPLLAALREVEYRGWTEIFMHPVPRGVPILEPVSAVTAEINRARSYLAECLRSVSSR